MRIGIDGRLYRAAAAGIGRYSRNLIGNLLEIDHDNEYVLFMSTEDKLEFENLKNSFEIKNLKFKIVTTDIPHYSLSEQTKFLKILNRQKLDLMHFTNFNFPVRYKGKFVATIHDLTLFYYPGRHKKGIMAKLAYKYVMKKACGKAAKIIAVSSSTKNDIIKTFKTNPQKIQVIYEAADDKVFAAPLPSEIDKIKRRYAVSDLPVILYVGQWRPHKNLAGLIRAFAILRKDVPAKLALVGKVDHAYPEVFETIDKEGVLRDIIMPGFVEEKELAVWYKIAAVFVFPSFYEGFGLPGLEAMAAGTPVAAANRTSLPEIYQDGAVYFDPADPHAIASAITKVIKDQNLRRQMIQKGYQIVKQYSWRKTAEETLRIYKSLK